MIVYIICIYDCLCIYDIFVQVVKLAVVFAAKKYWKSEESSQKI